MASRSFGSQSPQIPHLSKGEVADLRNDIESAFTSLEAEVDALGGSGPASLGTIVAACRSFNGGTEAQYGVQGCTVSKAGTGDYEITLSTPLASADEVFIVPWNLGGGGRIVSSYVMNASSGGIQVAAHDGTPADATVSFLVFKVPAAA